MREIFLKKSLSEMIQNCLIWKEKTKKNFGGKQRFLTKTAIPLPFLHSSILYLFKLTAMPNFSAVTLFGSVPLTFSFGIKKCHISFSRILGSDRIKPRKPCICKKNCLELGPCCGKGKRKYMFSLYSCLSYEKECQEN